MRLFIIFFTLLFTTHCKNDLSDIKTFSQPKPRFASHNLSNIDKLYQDFYTNYTRYKEQSIRTRRFKHAELVPLIQKLRAPFEVRKAGASLESRDIYRIKLGTGKTQVFLWSQMHGDESTATMALLDIFNFFNSTGDGFDAYRQKVLQELTLTFIPMLNPDGAELFQRRNALDIDLNRDALRLQFPESKILKAVRDELKADWGFNLHDQGSYYVGDKQTKLATFSFLAPAYNAAKEVNEVRGDAMKMIVGMNEIIQAYIPNQVGRYNDTFEPRAFGDNMQKWGTRTILIECGLQKDDPEKQAIRRLHFVILLAAFDAIANDKYKQADVADYNKISFNINNSLFSLIVREAQVQHNGNWYTVDMGFKRGDNYPSQVSANQASITEFGDMSIFSASNEINAKGYRAVPGKVYPTIVQNTAALKQLNVMELLEQGYTDVRLREFPTTKGLLPFNLLKVGAVPDNNIRLKENPSFILQKNGETHYAVVNGFGYDLRKEEELIRQLVEAF